MHVHEPANIKVALWLGLSRRRASRLAALSDAASVATCSCSGLSQVALSHSHFLSYVSNFQLLGEIILVGSKMFGLHVVWRGIGWEASVQCEGTAEAFFLKAQVELTISGVDTFGGHAGRQVLPSQFQGKNLTQDSLHLDVLSRPMP